MNLELGNLAFNLNKNQKYRCPNWVIALLRDIERELKLTMFAINHIDYDSPFDNTGNSFKELSDIFEVCAYNWDDNNPTDYNFMFNCGNNKQIKISWYKYLGRDTTINVDLESTIGGVNAYLYDLIINQYNCCIKALKKYREDNENTNRLNPIQNRTNKEACWEIGNSNDEDILYLNLKGKFDMRYSHFHLCLSDAQLLANDIFALILNTQLKEPKLNIVRLLNKEEE